MVATLSHIGWLCVCKSTPTPSWNTSQMLRTSGFIIYLPACRNTWMNEFTWLWICWIVATISLSKPSTIQHHILTCASTSLLKMYNWAELGILVSSGSNVLTWWHSARLVLDALWCGAFISWAWMRSSRVISALHSAQNWVFCCQIICASSSLNSRRVSTLSSACQCNSVLKWDIALHMLVFLCTLLEILHQMLDTFPHYQQNFMLSHALKLLSSLYILKLYIDLSLRLHFCSFLHP